MSTWQKRYAASLMNTFGLPRLQLTKGAGSTVWDSDGNAYLDLLFIADTDKTGPGHRPGDANTVSYVNVGYVSQNVYLYCASAGLGSRARGGWDQQKVIETLGLKESMIVVLGQTVGYCE